MTTWDFAANTLRAAAEPTRLRLLALCRDQRVSVSEFAEVLAASEPSVSRHLKLLEEAQLVRRAREGQRVYFSVERRGPHEALIAALLAQLVGDDGAARRDRERLLQLRGGQSTQVSLRFDSRLGRALAALARAQLAGGSLPDSVSVTQLREADLLVPLFECALAVQARVASGAERSALLGWCAANHPAAQLRVRSGTVAARQGESFDLVIADCSALGLLDLQRMLDTAVTSLHPQGALWLCASYDALERGEAAEHPLLLLRRLLSKAGLNCERLQPIEVEGTHILFSVARPAAQALRAAG